MAFEVMNPRYCRHEVKPGFAGFQSDRIIFTHADLLQIGIGKDDPLTLLADKALRAIAVRKSTFPEKPIRRDHGPEVTYIIAKKALDFIGISRSERPGFCAVEFRSGLLVVRLAPIAANQLDLRESA